jgi:4-hydroxy-tetrahydrodipicolinate reductase
MRIAIIGHGKMGRMVAEVVGERGHVVHTVVEAGENAGGRALTRERLAGADVAVEFTRPEAVVSNLERLIELQLPTVTGTTGWSEHLARISSLVQRTGGALLYAPNFSLGVHHFLGAARQLARGFRGRSEFTASIVEQHHKTKRDAPSGTALLLQRELEGEDPDRQFPITSLRVGDSPGQHTLTYESRHETLALTHVSQSRYVFAAGALDAAEWLPGRTGVFTFGDMLSGNPA